MITVEKEKWVPSQNIILEKTAEYAVKTQESILVVAGPGAGKTELLAQKANYLFETAMCKDPYKILAISFKRDAARNLKERIIERCGKEVASRFDSMTYDAFAKSILDHFRMALPEELRPNQDYVIQDDNILNRAFRKYNIYYKKSFDKILMSTSFPFTQNGIGENVWKLLLKGFDGNESTLTFKMISMLAEYIVRTNSMIKVGLQTTYKYVFLDEFQDTTDLQYLLLKQCFLDSTTSITAVGDSKQRIMIWAGARKTVFDDFQKEFNALKYTLFMNHRSAPRLVDLQRKMYDILNESETRVYHSKKWNADDGIVNLIIADNNQSETTEIVNMIIRKINSGIQPRQICILCKQKPQNYTDLLIQTLKKNNIEARNENEFQDLIKEPIVEILLSFLTLAANNRSPTDWQWIVSFVVELWNISSVQSYDDYYETQEKIDNELKWIKQHININTTRAEFYSVIKHIVDFLGIERIKAMFSEYNQGRYINGILNKFVLYFWTELEKTSISLITAVENFKGLNSIPIMTIHKSKGLEYEVVFFIGLEDSAFWSFKNQPEEDRCAFFVALSRAKREVTFSFCKTRNNTIQKHDDINEFFELLKSPGIATIIEC